MRLDKYKIKKNKLGFFFLCFGIFCSILFMTRINELFVESVEIEAVVTKAYRSSGKAGSGGPKMNIEWIDLNGEIQTEGNLHNDLRLEEGDTHIIRVDAETNSRIVLSAKGSICMFVMGFLGCVICLGIMIIVYRQEKL